MGALEPFGMGAVLEQATVAGPVVYVCGIGGAIVLLGFALTAIRYARFEVWRGADGRLSISYGLFSRHRRGIDPDAIVGIVLRRNLVETALGRVRLLLLTTDSTAQLGANLVLPSLPRRIVTRLIGTAFSDYAGAELLSASRGTRPFVSGMACLLSMAVACVAIWWAVTARGWPLYVAALCALVLLIIMWRGTQLLCSRLTVSDNAHQVRLTRMHVVHEQRVLLTGCVHAVSTTHVLGRQLIARVSYYAGAPKELRSMRYDPEDLEAFRRVLAATSASSDSNSDGFEHWRGGGRQSRVAQEVAGH